MLSPQSARLLFGMVVSATLMGTARACGAMLPGSIAPQPALIDESTVQDRLRLKESHETDLKEDLLESKRRQYELEKELRRAVQCRQTTCDFDAGVLCRYKTSGKPGASKEMLEEFYLDNPAFRPPEPAGEGQGESYPLTVGDWAEQTDPSQLTLDQQVAIGSLQEILRNELNAEIADRSAVTMPTVPTLPTLPSVGLRSRHKRQASPEDVADLLVQLSKSSDPESLLSGRSDPAAQLVQKVLGGKTEALGEWVYTRTDTGGEYVFGPVGHPDHLLTEDGYYPLESLGVYVEPGEREAAKELLEEAVGDLEGDANQLAKSNKTWGAVTGAFGNEGNEIYRAAEDGYYAATYVYPGERAIMMTPVQLSEDDYHIFYHAWENTEGLELQLACDTVDNVVVRTSSAKGSGRRRTGRRRGRGRARATRTRTRRNGSGDSGDGGQVGEGRDEWRRQAGLCPQGTKAVLFICDNSKGSMEGPCGVDDVELRNGDGDDFCRHVDMLTGDQPGDMPQSADDRLSPLRGAGGKDALDIERVPVDDLVKIQALLNALEGN